MNVPKPAVPPPPERVRPVMFHGQSRRPTATLTRRLLAEQPDVDMAAVLGRRGFRVRWRVLGFAEQIMPFGRNKVHALQHVETLRRRHGHRLLACVVEARHESPWEVVDDVYRPPTPKEQR